MEEMVAYAKDFYQNKTVLITGNTGFKGSWLSMLLLEFGAKVIGYSLQPKTIKDNFVLAGLENKIINISGDIRDTEKLEKIFLTHQPEIVFHLAAQPLVRLSYAQPRSTYEVNVMGTLNVLEAVRDCDSVRETVIITTDKCYENKEQMWGYRENDALGGFDPYSSSKACAEILTTSYRNSFLHISNYEMHRKSIATARSGNVIGGGDWSEDRIIPDCIRAIEKNEKIEIRNPKAVRPWQHVIEPIFGYILLAMRMREDPVKFSGAWNFGPDIGGIETVEKLVGLVCSEFTYSNIKMGQSSNLHETELLLLDNSKAKLQLGWRPVFGIDETVLLVSDWYRQYKSRDVHTLCLEQIEKYLKACNLDNIQR